MAISQNTLIGRTKQSVGGVTFTTWKGLNVIKSKAISVANPQTPAQRLQRARLSLMVSIYRIIAEPIQIGFNPQAIGKSEYNAFLGANMQTATAGSSAENVSFVPEECMMSMGTIGVTAIQSIIGTPNSEGVAVSWPQSSNPIGSSPSDIAVALVYNETQDKWGFNTEGTERSVGALVVTMPAESENNDILHGYLFFKSPANNDVSDSTYLKQTV